MPKFLYSCSALVLEDGTHGKHEIDVPQKIVDRYDPPSASRMGNTESHRGEPPKAHFCDEHQGWATIIPLTAPEV